VIDDGVANTLTGPTGNGAPRNWFIVKKLSDSVTKRTTETTTTL